MSYLLPTGIPPGKTEFFGLDAENTFQVNLKEFGTDWIWYNRDIVYNFNKHGYRMNKGLDKIDFDNYIAFFGCSNTVGLGLPLEETFSYQIADKCGMNYVNAAVPGGSCDFVVKNFVKMIEEAPAHPKIVVVNWPEISRTFYWFKNHIIQFYPSMRIDSMPVEAAGRQYWNESFKRFVSEDSNLKNQFDHLRKTVVSICKLANIKLFECASNLQSLPQPLSGWGQYVHPQVNSIIWPSEPEPTNKYSKNKKSGLMIPTAEYIDWINKYFARDILVTGTDSKYVNLIKTGNVAHPGVAHQKQIVDLFFSKIVL